MALALASGFPGWAQDADNTGETSAALPAASDSSAPSQDAGTGTTSQTEAPTQGSDAAEAAPPEGTPEKSEPPESPEAELAPFGYAFFGRAPSTYAPIADTPVPPNYSLGPGDSLRISLRSAIGQETVVSRPIDATGRVDLPLLGTVTARGMTLKAFEAMVLREYRRQFHQIQGRVTVDRIRSLQVMVTGEAARPGLYTISALSTAFNAIYHAGGPTPRGSMRRIEVIRGNRTIATLDLYDYLLTGRKAQDCELESGDTLFIPVVGPVVGIRGWVKRPALYELKGGERLRDLIAMAGGIRAATYLKLVQIERVRAHAERILVDADVSTLLAGDDTHNLELCDGDLISIGTVLDQRTNSVEIAGRVARAGSYELKPGMRATDLLDAAQRQRRGTWAYDVVALGYNYRLTDFQCALGLSQLARLPAFLARRRRLAARYLEGLRDLPEIRLPVVRPGVRNAWHLFAIRIEPERLTASRDEIFAALRAENIGVNVHYRPVHLLTYYRQRLGTGEGLCPRAEAASERLLTLPLFPRMSDADADDAIAAVRKVIGHYRR